MPDPGRGDDLLGALTRTIDGLGAAGFEEEAKELRGLAFDTAWTSSSEMIGEIGLAILRTQRRAAGGLPAEVVSALESCMDHVRQVWPDIKLGKRSGALCLSN